VQGQAASSPAQARLAGLRQGLDGSAVTIVGVVDGNWTSEDAEKAPGDWLLLMLRAGRQTVGLVGCQSDEMATGVKEALAATIVVPSTGAPAVDQLLKAIATRRAPPAELILHVSSYPDEPSLASRAR
jgi:ABC-type sugar transport system substrate-binding protein